MALLSKVKAMGRYALVLAAPLLMAGCVKQHAKWNEVPLNPPILFPYTSPSSAHVPQRGSPIYQGLAQKDSPAQSNASTSFAGAQTYTRSSWGGSGRGAYRSRNGYRWLAVAVLILFFVAPLVWFFYPSVRRATRSKPAPAPVTPVPQLPPKETWSAKGLCLLCGSRMIERVAKRGKHKGKPVYGCAKYPQCKGSRGEIPQTNPPSESPP